MLTAGVVRQTKPRLLLLLAVTCSLAANTTRLCGQQNAAPASGSAPAANRENQTPEFEVASIKTYKPEGEMIRVMTRFMPDGITASGVSLQLLIRSAYGVEDNQILGAPSWIGSDQYDIQAKIDEADVESFAKLDPKQASKMRMQMLQGLLSDRFKLALHRETRELPVYALVVAKGGLKLQEAKEGDTYPNGIKAPDGHPSGGMMRMGRGELAAQALPVGSLISILTQQLGRHIEDKTGLTGKYDFTLKWTPDEAESPMFRGALGGGASAPAPDANGPSIFTALQEQLGLKLESQKGPVEVLVIDHAEKPIAD